MKTEAIDDLILIADEIRDCYTGREKEVPGLMRLAGAVDLVAGQLAAIEAEIRAKNKRIAELEAEKAMLWESLVDATVDCQGRSFAEAIEAGEHEQILGELSSALYRAESACRTAMRMERENRIAGCALSSLKPKEREANARPRATD